MLTRQILLRTVVPKWRGDLTQPPGGPQARTRAAGRTRGDVVPGTGPSGITSEWPDPTPAVRRNGGPGPAAPRWPTAVTRHQHPARHRPPRQAPPRCRGRVGAGPVADGQGLGLGEHRGGQVRAATHAVALTLRGCRCLGSRLLTAGRRGWLLVLLRSPPGDRVDLPGGQLTRGLRAVSAGDRSCRSCEHRPAGVAEGVDYHERV